MSRQVTLSLQEDRARLVVIERRRVVSWDSLALSPRLSNGYPEEVGRQISKLLQSAGAQTSRLIVELDNPAILTRYLSLPKIPRGYMSKIVAGEVAETIPFSLNEVDISWQAFPNGQGWHVLAFCIPNDVLDSRIKILKSASLRPLTMYPKSLALAHAVAEKDAVILDLEPGSTDIVIVLQGIPCAVHQSRTSLDNGSRHQALQALIAEVEQLLQFNESNGSKATDRAVVVPTGKLADAELVTDLANAWSRSVRRFQPLLDCPSDFPASEYAANLGLALATATRTRGGLPSINVLPARHRPAPFPWRQVAIFGFLLAMVAVAPSIGQRVAQVGYSAHTIEDRLGSLRAVVREELFRANEALALRQDIDRTRALTQEINSQSQKLAASEAALMRRVKEAVTDAVPEGVEVLSLSYGTGKVGLQAQAVSYYSALQYVDQIKASAVFQKVTLEKAQASDNGVSFQVLAVY